MVANIEFADDARTHGMTQPGQSLASLVLGVDWLSRLGTGLLAMMAASPTGSGGGGAQGKAGDYAKPSAAPGGMPQPIPRCCSLALPNTPCNFPAGRPKDFTCPPGYHRQWWNCCEGTHVVACGECTKSTSNCWTGPFICSIWWPTTASC
jgi:hypothetical protein